MKMTVTNSGIQYALVIIGNHFGNLVSKVCESLLNFGPTSLSALIRSTQLTPQQVKNSLLILIQHNCVQAFVPESDDGPRVVQYLVLFDNILHRLRFGKFLGIVAEELDNECKQLLGGLLEHGRLTRQQIIDRGTATNKSQDQNAVNESFIRLVNARFVERCPAPEPVLEKPPEQEGPKRPRTKSAKMAQVIETIEQRVLRVAGPMEGIRFSILTDSETDALTEKTEKNSSSTSVGEKRKFDDLDVDGELGSIDKKGILWRANFEEFIRCLRHKACVENVKARYDENAAVVLRALLKATRTAEKKVKIDHSVPLKIDAIYDEVMNSEAGHSPTLDHVRAYLSLLCESPLETGIGDDEDESYSVDLKKIIELLQNNEVESILLKRYDTKTADDNVETKTADDNVETKTADDKVETMNAYRIFRLLSNQSNAGRFFETDKISEMALVDPKEAPKVLFKLWNDDYVRMENIFLTTPRPMRIMVWKVDKPIVWEHVLDEMYHAACNLLKRLYYEFKENKEVRDLRKEEKERRLNNVRKYLTASLVKLDDALMLFHDF